MEKIIVKNFGPIKHVELELKDINVFIGHTSSGKSTVAKLVAICREISIAASDSFDRFKELLVQYNIDFKVTNKTFIKYHDKDFFWELKNKKIKNNGENWILTRILTLIEELSNALVKTKRLENNAKLTPQAKRQKMLALFLISGGFDEIIKIEYQYLEEELPTKVQLLLNVIKEYREQLDTENLADQGNIAVLNEAVQDSRFTDLLPLVDVEIGLSSIIYIPAERTFLSMVAESLFGLMNHDVSIAKCIKDFGAQFEIARKELNHFSIPFLDVEYKYSDKSNFITFGDGARIKLEQASSGLQSIVPLLLVIEANTTEKSAQKNYLLIEEPELNLYPTVQKELTEFIIERINRSHNKLIITTHSPYILTSLDNLIQADNAAKTNPESKDKVAEIVPEQKWVSFDRVACYFFEDGTCRSTLDTENQTIGASNIDDVSEELGKTFDQLLELKYAHVS